MEGVFHYLAAQFDDPELDWKVRHRDNADRLIAGGVLGVAEVVKGLHSLSRIRPLPTKEREQYDNARHLLVHEVAVSLGVPPVLAEDYIDFALMPPVGVKFDLKPPPTPVLLPSRPKKRRPAVEEEDDLGLGDLGLDVDLAGVLDAAAAVPGEAVTGEPAEEGAAGEKDEAEAAPLPSEDEEEAELPRPVRERPPARAATKGAKPEKAKQAVAPKEKAPVQREKAPAHKERAPARKAHAKKAPAAKKHAAKKPAKAAPKRGGKK
jgi:hypothetical protein